MREVNLANIPDLRTREAVQIVYEDLRVQDILTAELRHFEITFPSAVDNFRFPHRLGYLPKIAWTVYLSTPVGVIWNYHLFDKEFLDVTVSAACTVGVFIGAFVKGQRI